VSGRTLVLALLAAGLLAQCSRLPDEDELRAFDHAETAFSSAVEPGGFLEAAALYESMLKDRYENSAVLYNLGNAYAKAGENGRAIAAYRRALRYRPRDPYLLANLESVQGKPSPETDPSLLELLLFWRTWLSYPLKARLFLCSAALVFVLAFARVLLRTRRRAIRPALAAAVILFLLCGLTFSLDVMSIEFSRHGVITKEIVARKGNGEGYDPAFNEPLAEGTELQVLERRGDWLKIRLGKNLTGWVPESEVAVY